MSSKSVRYWDKQADHFERVGRAPGWFKSRLRLLEGLAGSKVVEIGCGAGDLVLAMLERGIDGYGLDVAPRMVEKARAALYEAGFNPHRIKQADVTALPCESSAVDVVISTGVLGVLSRAQQPAALAEMSRVARYELRLLEPYHRKPLLGLLMDGQRPLSDEQLRATGMIITPHWDAMMGVFTYLLLKKHDVLVPSLV